MMNLIDNFLEYSDSSDDFKKIDRIFFDFSYSYEYDSLTNKFNLFNSEFQTTNLNKEFPFESEVIEFDTFVKYWNTYNLKLQLLMTDNSGLLFPYIMAFGKIEIDLFLRYLALLNQNKPRIQYEFYDKDDIYGKGNIVLRDNSVLKSIFIVNDERKKINLREYCRYKIKEYKNEAIIELTRNYLAETDDFKDFRNQKYENIYPNYLNESYYNDNLDIDQQDIDFWDSQ